MILESELKKIILELFKKNKSVEERLNLKISGDAYGDKGISGGVL